MKANELGWMVNNLGQEVPIKYVPKYDKLRDKSVRKILGMWEKERAALEKVVAESIKELGIVLKARSEDCKMELAKKGNFSVSSFDGNITVRIEQQYRILLDDRVKEAQAIMEAYAERLVGKVGGQDGKALAILIRGTFAPSRSGTLSIAKVWVLCGMEIPDPEWERARKLLIASMQPIKGKAYIRVGVRRSVQEDYKFIRLDAADCWPMTDQEKTP